jgi:hypothetical protein
MRKAILCLITLGTVAFIAAPAAAGTVNLGTISQSSLKATCKKNGGTFSPSNGNTYDCIGKGEKGGVVSCDAKTQQCTGSCEKCGQARVVSGTTVRGVLINASAEIPRAASNPIKPGLFDQAPVLGTTGPAATGTPLGGGAAPATPAPGPVLR